MLSSICAFPNDIQDMQYTDIIIILLLSIFFFTFNSLGAESLNPKTGSLLPAVAREASYTYEHDPAYCGATYHGMWLQGKPHGQ